MVETNIPKPPSRRSSRLPAPEPTAPLPMNTLTEVDEKATVDMNFKVNPQMRAMVKMQAGARGMTTKAMIELALKEFWENHPISIRIG